MAVIQLGHDELEALHLCDGEGKTQEEAGSSMGISRGTVQRLVASARQKVARTLVERKALVISADLFPDGNAAPGEGAADHQGNCGSTP